MSPHSNFTAAFTKGYIFQSQSGPVPMRQLLLGNFVAPSGQIIASDPLYISDTKAFKKIAPKGKHPVYLAIATLWGKDDRVACARIVFRKTKPVKWRSALTKEQKLKDLEPNTYYGFGVDSATGCYVDATALKDGNARSLGYKIESALENTPQKKRKFGAIVPVGRWGGPTLVGFYTGLGDGSYPSYWGFDRNNRLVTLETDFQLLLDTIDTTVVINDISNKLNQELQDQQMKKANLSLCVSWEQTDNPMLLAKVNGSAYVNSVCLLLDSEELHCCKVVGTKEVTYYFQLTQEQRAANLGIKIDFTKEIKPLL